MVDAAHVCEHPAGSGLGGQKPGLQYHLLVGDGIERGHGAGLRAIGGIHECFGRGGERFANGFFARPGGRHGFVPDREACVLPQEIVVHARRFSILPVFVKGFLQFHHAFSHRGFGFRLHVSVDGQCDAQTVTEEVVGFAVAAVCIREDGLDFSTQKCAEILCRPPASFEVAVVDVEGQGLKCVESVYVYRSVAGHQGQNRVAAFEGGLGVEAGIVRSVRLEHADERGYFLDFQFVEILIEKPTARRLDAVNVFAEAHGVEVQRDDLLLVIQVFEFQRGDVLPKLVDGNGEKSVALPAEYVFDQLLRQGAASTRGSVTEHHRAYHHAGDAVKVDAFVLEVAAVFGGHQCVDHDGRNIFEFYARTVLYKVRAQELSV